MSQNPHFIFSHEEIFSDEDKIPAIRRLQYLQLKSKYWKRWSKEYLVNLRERHKIVNGKQKQIKKGDIVLIKDDNLPRNLWKLGKVLDTIQGRDGVIRGATLRTTTMGAACDIDRPL